MKKRWCIVVALIGAGVGASISSAATELSPGIRGVVASPSAIPAAGGLVLVTARVMRLDRRKPERRHVVSKLAAAPAAALSAMDASESPPTSVASPESGLSIETIAPGTVNAHSNNWSGYSVTGGPFTLATGTFEVPTLSFTAASAVTSEWVGISGGPGRLIQAGVTESYDATAQAVRTYAWWEILPSSETRIPLPVTSGDEMTVTVGQSAPGRWRIWVVDNTTGEAFSTEQAYPGLGGAADWIVEAPTSVSSGAVNALGQYTPGVTFSNLGFTGASGSMIQWGMVQGGALVSVASALTDEGFNVAYGAGPPPAPA